MTAPVELHNVTKRYRLGRERLNLRHAMPGRAGDKVGGDVHTALNDVSIAVAAGETLGIIGPNGAGKTTVLKLVARVVKPTSGRVDVRGRTAALIELGAGFHPDMTGRENVQFSAAVLGMGRRALRSRFDAIVDFAGIGPYLDSPVKRYSSGMLARLGFAVASHLDAEVLVIDEVLAVGDSTFQRQCYQRIEDLRSTGCSVLYVTHTLWTVPLLCERALLLQEGRVLATGDPTTVVNRYLDQGGVPGRLSFSATAARIEAVRLSAPAVGPSESIEITIALDVLEPLPSGHLLVAITGADGTVLAGLSSVDQVRLDAVGRFETRCRLDRLPLLPGTYSILVSTVPESGMPVADDQRRVEVEVVGEPADRATYGLIALEGAWSQVWSSERGPT